MKICLSLLFAFNLFSADVLSTCEKGFFPVEINDDEVVTIWEELPDSGGQIINDNDEILAIGKLHGEDFSSPVIAVHNSKLDELDDLSKEEMVWLVELLFPEHIGLVDSYTLYRITDEGDDGLGIFIIDLKDKNGATLGTVLKFGWGILRCNSIPGSI